jgi:hypothetical protein
MAHGVYITTNPESGKFYIGKHNFKGKNDYYKGSGVWVKKCKAAKLKLETQVIALCQTEKDAYDFERVLVRAFKAKYADLCMNFSEGGVGFVSGHNAGKPSTMRGKKHTEEAKQKIGLWGKKHKAGEKHHMYGKNHTDATRQKMSESHRKSGHLRGKKVKCIETNQVFLSLADAARFACGYVDGRNNIRKCCNGKMPYAYGFTWSYFID